MLTVVIPTFNNMNSIEKVLQSAEKVADNIVVIDSFSDDITLDIVRKYSTSIFQRKYIYSADQKNWILDKVNSKWVLILDSDEILSDRLIAEINNLKQGGISDDIIAYRIPFIHYFWGKPISGVTEKKIKLFRPELFRFEDKLVHAHPVTESNREISTLSFPVYHFGIKSIKDWFTKMNIYSTWDCIERNKKKEICRWEIILKPPIYFLKVLFMEKALFFGFVGIISTIMKAIIFFQILLKHYELYHNLGDKEFMRILRE